MAPANRLLHKRLTGAQRGAGSTDTEHINGFCQQSVAEKDRRDF
jgi:hypothetical protein